jgi:ABC-type nitrate/sulfonate/bicarbonate transport system substrate-binding protein
MVLWLRTRAGIPAAAGALFLAACGSPASQPAPATSSAAPSAPPVTHVKIGFTSKSTGGLYMYLGRDLGIFQKHGIDPEIVIGQSEALVTGLNQGDIEFMGTLPSAVQGAEKGLPIRSVFVAKDHPEYLLIGDNGVSQVSQLKGKQLAGSIATQLPTQMMRRLLDLDGVQFSDYTVVAVSNDSARTALVANHRVAAGILGLSQSLPLMDEGHPVIDSTLSKVYWPSSGLSVTLDTLSKRRDMVQRAVAAALESTKVAAEDKERTVGVLVKDFDLTPDQAGRLFDLMKPAYTLTGRANPEGVKFQLETDAKAMELPKPATEAEVYDYSLLPK